MKVTRVGLWLLVVVIFVGAGCTASALDGSATAETLVTIEGSSALFPLIGQAASDFQAQHPAIRVEVRSMGLSRSVRDGGCRR
jgi:ABC-type phosphate transport system substrate-binding protein